MTQTHEPQFGHFQRRRVKSIDTLALGAALLWFALMITLSWWASETPVMTWLIRGMWGAIFVYVAVFLILQAAVVKMRSRNGEDLTPTDEIMAHAPVVEDGEEAEIVSENVAE